MAVSNSVSSSNTLKFDEVVGVILSEEMRRKSTGETSTSSGSALNVENRGRTSERGKGPSHGKSRGKSNKGHSQSKGKKDCWYCGKPGHLKKDCWSRKNKQGDRNEDNSKEANVASNTLQDALILCLDNVNDSWVIDSGASFHATPHRKYFQDYVQGDFGQVYLGDDEPCPIVGKGKIKIKLPNGNDWVLQEVRHVPNLRRNLISAGQLGSEGCIVMFTDNVWKVTKGSLVVAKGSKIGTLYLCTGNTYSTLVATDNVNAGKATIDVAGTDSKMWHHRLGHMSEKGMKILHSKNLLPGLKNIDLELCENCVYGKQKRVRFLRVGKEKKSEKLELVHSDVWGPAQVSSLGGSHYYVIFIDDSTRKTWVYFLKQKSDVFETFKKWKALVENETGKKLKCLRSDNGGEYCSTTFEDYYSINGIRR